MNIKVLRNIHLYLGCVFAPLLLFFVVSGCWQTFELHHGQKSAQGYQPPAIVKSLSDVHTEQRWEEEWPSSKMFRILVLAMSVGVLITTILGIVMAFKFTKPWVVWACLAVGTLAPAGMIWLVSFTK